MGNERSDRGPAGRAERPSGRRATDAPTLGSTLIYGPCRPLVNLLVFGAARAQDPEPHWLDVRSPDDETPDLDPVVLGWIAPDRLGTVDPAEAFTPDHARANAALFELVRDDEPPALLARLSDLLRLPPQFRKILAERPTSRRAGVIAVANADRSGLDLAAADLGPILAASAWAGYSLIVGYCGPVAPGRGAFATVLRADGESVDGWSDTALVLEGGTSREGLSPGEPARLRDLPFAASVLRRAEDEIRNR